jgi:hypothetical protein
MVAAHRNPALNKLDSQLKAAHPGMEIGWIADKNHKPPSDHIPDPDGTVDALDPMLGTHYTRDDAERDVLALAKSRDKRIAYIIFQRQIISSTVKPWVWRPYSGSDPHTGHWHISTLDEQENSTTEWKLYVPYNVPTIEISGTVPLLKQGMADQPGAVAHIHRMQHLLGVTADGDFGANTEKALRTYLGTSYHGTVDLDAWRKLLGLW